MNEDLASKLSSLLEENNIDLNQILENFNQSQNSENPSKNQETPTSNNPPNDTNNIDPSTILKIQKLLTLMNSNKNSSDEQLLKSLKPYMRNSRKEKIDKYIKILHVMKLLENFQEMGGNLNDFL